MGEEEGVFSTDRELRVRSWNGWLVRASGIPEGMALGERLGVLFPELEERGLLERLRRVAEEGSVEVLAPAFHQYLIPCAPLQPVAHFTRMQQQVTLAPLRVAGELAGVSVRIRDVTARREQERRTADALRSGDEAVRLRTVEALAAYDASPDVLVDAFDDQSWRVRHAAVEAVAQHHGDGVVEVLTQVLREQHRDLSVLNATLSALAASGERVLPALLELLSSPDADLRVYVALALGLRGEVEAVPALLAALEDADDNVRFHALEALGRLRAREAAPRVAEVAAGGDFGLAFAALDALAAIGDESVTSGILPLLGDEMLRPAALDALGRLGGEEAVAPLAALLARDAVPAAEPAAALAAIYGRFQQGFEDGEVIAALAAATLPAGGAERVRDALASAYDDALPALARVLGWLRVDGGVEALVQALGSAEARAVAAEGLVRAGRQAAPALAESLADLEDDALRAAVHALGRIGSPEAVPALLERLESSPEASVWVAGALGAIGDRRAFEPLQRLLGHPGAAVRQAAVAALSSIGHPGLRQRAGELLGSPMAAVREAAVRITAYFGYPESLEPLLALAGDPDEAVRRAAVEQIAGYDDPRVAQLLAKVLKTAPAPERAAAARALRGIGEDASAPLLSAALADPDLWVRYYAARSAAGRTEHGPALDALARRDPAVPVRIAALDALGECGVDDACATALALREDPEPEVRQAALRVLAGATTPEVLRTLVEALQGPDMLARRAVLEALGHDCAALLADDVAAAARSAQDRAIGNAAAAALLRADSLHATRALAGLTAEAALRDPCVQALARIPAGRGVLLAGVLREGSEGERAAVLAALAHLGTPAAQRLVAGALQDRSPALRRTAEHLLTRLDLRAAVGGAGHG